MNEVASIMIEVGFSAKLWRSVECLAVIWAESGGDAYSININDYDPNLASYLSIDVGLCQWNSFWQKSISIQDALDPTKALKLMCDKTAAWTVNKTLWNAYNNGSYQKFLHDARASFEL